MPISALPPHLQNWNWEGTDNAGWLMQIKKKLQILIAAGPRVSETTFPQRFFKWREFPELLFLWRGEGEERWESTDGSQIETYGPHCSKAFGYYLYYSRIQPWLRWSISLSWPLFFNCHFIYRKEDVVEYPTYQSAFGIRKMFTFGIGFKRDSDKIYWLTTNAGGNFE